MASGTFEVAQTKQALATQADPHSQLMLEDALELYAAATAPRARVLAYPPDRGSHHTSRPFEWRSCFAIAHSCS